MNGPMQSLSLEQVVAVMHWSLGAGAYWGCCAVGRLSFIVLQHKAHTSTPPIYPSRPTASIMNASPTTKDLIQTLFTRDGNVFTCRICTKTRCQDVRSGYANLRDHLAHDHSGSYVDKYHAIRATLVRWMAS